MELPQIYSISWRDITMLIHNHQYSIILHGDCKMPELQINKFVDPAFYTDHNILDM